MPRTLSERLPDNIRNRGKTRLTIDKTLVTLLNMVDAFSSNSFPTDSHLSHLSHLGNWENGNLGKCPRFSQPEDREKAEFGDNLRKTSLE